MATVGEIVGHLRLKGGAQFERSLRGRLRNVRREFSGLNTAIAGVGLVATFRALNKEANELASAQLGLESIAAFKGLQNVEKTVRDMKVVKEGLISFADASQSVQNLLRRGFTLEQAVVLMERLANAAAFSRQQHLTFGEALKSATQGLKNENSILLDNAGITKNLAQMWKEYAQSIGKGAMSLSIAEKVQAEYNGVLKETEAQTGDLDKLLNTQIATQARTAASAQEAMAKFGQLAQILAGPLFEAANKVFKFFIDAPQWIRNTAAALGIVTVAAKLFGGALTALLPALGPVGWIAIGITAVIGLFSVFENRAEKAKERLAEFRTEAEKMKTGAALNELGRLRAELKKTEADIKRLRNTPRVNIEFFENRADELRNQIKVLKAEIDKRAKVIEDANKKQEKAATATATALTDKEKETLDERMENQFAHQAISRDAYLAHLRQRIQDFEKWTDEWTERHELITELEKDAQRERQANEAAAALSIGAIRDKFARELPEKLGQASEDGLSRYRSNLEAMAQVTQDKIFTIVDYFNRLGAALSESLSNANFNPAKAQLKNVFKEILVSLLDFLQRYVVLAKIKTILDGVFNPLQALKSAAPLLAASALISAAKGSITSLADGSVVSKPTLALVGDQGAGSRFEVVAPEKSFMDYSNELIERVLAGRNDSGRGGPVLNIYNSSPIVERRTQQNMADKVLRPELRRIEKRMGRR